VVAGLQDQAARGERVEPGEGDSRDLGKTKEALPSVVKKRKRPMEKSAPDKTSTVLPKGYAALLQDIKERIKSAQIKAALSVNRELLALYWQIGQQIVERQQAERWGNAVIDRLGADLQKAFPGLSGFSRTNVYRMRAFFLAYRNIHAIVPQAVGQLDQGPVPHPVANIPWGHNVLLIEKLKYHAERLWYASKTIEHGWSRSILDYQIDSGLYLRQGPDQL
jgi:predicted nuclease of restriction endonuclease-like (RecB) superfamily